MNNAIEDFPGELDRLRAEANRLALIKQVLELPANAQVQLKVIHPEPEPPQLDMFAYICAKCGTEFKTRKDTLGHSC